MRDAGRSEAVGIGLDSQGGTEDRHGHGCPRYNQRAGETCDARLITADQHQGQGAGRRFLSHCRDR
jgi:hypothetical protein